VWFGAYVLEFLLLGATGVGLRAVGVRPPTVVGIGLLCVTTVALHRVIDRRGS
jgi:hypothetical protein